MEEIWNKLSHGKEEGEGARSEGVEPVAKPVNGANGVHPAEGGVDTTNPSADEETVTSEGSKSKPAIGLDAVSEPAPPPIRADARLTPSPRPTPTAATPSEIDVAKTGVEGGAENASGEGKFSQEKMVASNETPSGEGQHLSDGNADETVVKSKSAAESIVDTKLLEEQTDKPHSPTQTPAPEEPPKEPSPEEILAEKRAKLALWNELKITVDDGPAPSDHKIRLERHDGEAQSLDEDDQEEDEYDGAYEDAEGSSSSRAGLSKETERLYLTFSWYFLHRGWQNIATLVKDAVEDVFGSVPLKAQLTHRDFVSLLNKVRRRVEYEARQPGAGTSTARSGVDDDGTSTLAASMASFDGRSETSEARFSRRGRRRNFLSNLFPADSEEEIAVLEAAGALAGWSKRRSGPRGAEEKDSRPRTLEEVDPTLCALVDETKDVIESSDFTRLLKLSLDVVFGIFEGTLRPTFGVEPKTTPRRSWSRFKRSEKRKKWKAGGFAWHRSFQLWQDRAN
ncbi:hypothetical protein L7F22_042873 [Adiantum nelumboides]|nr:hypothetical protein [Adiantum nelumboides]